MDKRYQRLDTLAKSRGAYSPKCLRDAEPFIIKNNGGNTGDSQKLLKYAILADRLDLFGAHCEVFGSLISPMDRASFFPVGQQSGGFHVYIG